MRGVLDSVSFAVDAGEVVGVSGPSGSGKTTVALALLDLLPADAIVSGAIALDGRDLHTLPAREREALRGTAMGIVFQESALALNPVLTVGAQIGEVVRAHTRCDRRERRARTLAAMHEVGLSDDTQRIYEAYPHELSGGQRQRVLIAQAIVCRPALVVADEPTASLDAAVRDDILRLIRRLNEQHGTSFLVISHSADVLERIAHRTIVMDEGRVAGVTRSYDVGSGARVSRSLSRSVSASRYAPIVEITGGAKSYRQRRLLSWSHHDVQALNGIELRVERGSTLGLAGPSGCGKSTLARCLAGLEPLDAGTVVIDGHDITGPARPCPSPLPQPGAIDLSGRGGGAQPALHRARDRHRADGRPARGHAGRAPASSDRAAVSRRPADRSIERPRRRVQRRRAPASGDRPRTGRASAAADSGRGVLRTRRRDAQRESPACC